MRRLIALSQKTRKMPRPDGRSADQLRSISIERNTFGQAAGRALIRFGNTTVLCSASISDDLPPWKLNAENPSGWVTAEYSMLPGSTSSRKKRDRMKVDGRTTEIQRLIGRSLRAVVDMHALGPYSITVDCDVLEADGGTRTASITGAFVALVEAVSTVAPAKPGHVFRDSVAAISVGVVDGQPVLDLPYVEDSRAEVDFNVVMTGSGKFVEVQGTAEGLPFDRASLDEQLALAERGIAELTGIQRTALGDLWPIA